MPEYKSLIINTKQSHLLSKSVQFRTNTVRKNTDTHVTLPDKYTRKLQMLFLDDIVS